MPQPAAAGPSAPQERRIPDSTTHPHQAIAGGFASTLIERSKTALKHAIGNLLSFAPVKVQTKAKELNELLYWRLSLKKAGGEFYNRHLEWYYTTLFDLPKSHYEGKRVLDIGCGPIGSLEWADDAAERVGIDPLADKYQALNGGKHRMQYVKGASEHMPFEAGGFDIVTMFNAFDHVEDIDQTIREISRVCAPGGDFLLIVEIDHPPSITEPHRIGEDIVARFEGFDGIRTQVFGIDAQHDVYGSIAARLKREEAEGTPGILCAHLRKQKGRGSVLVDFG